MSTAEHVTLCCDGSLKCEHITVTVNLSKLLAWFSDAQN